MRWRGEGKYLVKGHEGRKGTNRRKERKDRAKSLSFRHYGSFVTSVTVWGLCSKEAKVFISAVLEHPVYLTGAVSVKSAGFKYVL